MFNLIFYYCQNYFNLSVSFGWGKSQLQRQGSKAKDQRGPGLDNLQKHKEDVFVQDSPDLGNNNFNVITTANLEFNSVVEGIAPQQT
jgi:hypothetical protein